MSVITNYITSFNKLVRKLFIYLFEVKLNEKKNYYTFFSFKLSILYCQLIVSINKLQVYTKIIYI